MFAFMYSQESSFAHPLHHPAKTPPLKSSANYIFTFWFLYNVVVACTCTLYSVHVPRVALENRSITPSIARPPSASHYPIFRSICLTIVSWFFRPAHSSTHNLCIYCRDCLFVPGPTIPSFYTATLLSKIILFEILLFLNHPFSINHTSHPFRHLAFCNLCFY